MIPSGQEPAGLASRFLAGAVDAAVLAGSLAGLRFCLLALGHQLLVKPHFVILLGGAIWWIASVAMVPAYHVGFNSFAGRTPGKWLLGLRVVDPHGHPPGFVRSAVRFAALTLSIAPLFAGLLAIALDPTRRAWHDRIAGTRVVYDRAPVAPSVQVRLGPQRRNSGPTVNEAPPTTNPR